MVDAIRLSVLVAALIQLGAFVGCQRYDASQNAPGAATTEELVELYEAAHKAKSVEKLRAICFWEAQAGGRHNSVFEDPMLELFNLVQLEEVEYVEGPAPDPGIGGSARYVTRRRGQRRQVDDMIGPVYGKLVLIGSAQQDGTKRPVRLDPAYIAMEFNGCYYIDTLPLVTTEVIRSVRAGERSRAEPLPLGAPLPK